MATNKLNDKQIRGFIRDHDTKQAKADAAGAKKVISAVSDGGGLRLEIRGVGSPRWVLRYVRPLVKRTNEMCIGNYPDTTLAAAREAASECRAQIQRGIDPAKAKEEAKETAIREEAKAARTFGILLNEFLASRVWAAKTHEKNQSRINNHMGRLLAMSLEEITPRFLLDSILRPIHAEETQGRVRALISQVFTFAIASGDILTNPARDLAPALKQPVHKHFAAATTPEELQHIWQTILSIRSLPTRCALQLQFLTFQRPGNIIAMEWSEINTEKKEWVIPATKIKMKVQQKLIAKDHVVPLSDYALEVVNVIPKKPSIYCFPSERGMSRHISDMTMLAAMRAYGITKDQTTCHGARTTASTLANESGLFSADSIERQMAHVLPGGKVRNTYNQGDFADERIRLMNWWGEYLRALE